MIPISLWPRLQLHLGRSSANKSPPPEIGSSCSKKLWLDLNFFFRFAGSIKAIGGGWTAGLLPVECMRTLLGLASSVALLRMRFATISPVPSSGRLHAFNFRLKNQFLLKSASALYSLRWKRSNVLPWLTRFITPASLMQKLLPF